MIGKVIYSVLGSDVRLAGISISPAVTGQELPMPAITYIINSVTPNDTKDGVSRMDEISFTVIMFTNKYRQTLELSQIVREDLDRLCGVIESVFVQSIQYNGESDQYDYGSETYGRGLNFTARVDPYYVVPGGDYASADYSSSDYFTT